MAEVRLGAFQASLLRDHDIELVIDVPRSSPADLARYAHDLVERMSIGSATGSRRGLLLVIDVDAARVRLEVGHDLEDVFPDAFVSRVEYDQMAAFFAEGRVGDGVEATVELLVARVNQVDPGETRIAGDAGPPEDYSAGAGATVPAPVGAAPDRSPIHRGGELYGPASSPGTVMASYLHILSTRDVRPDLGIYTPDTRRVLAERLVTRAQQDNEYRQLSQALPRARYVEADSLAVALFDAEGVPPYFFIRGPEGWMLDLNTPSQSIRFDHENRWFFVEVPAPYAFAFD